MNSMNIVEPWAIAWQRTGRFMTERMEQLAALRMESLKAYIDLGVSQMKVAAKISNPRSAGEFSDSQYAVLSFVGHRVFDDGRMMAEWGVETCQQADRVARKNLLGFVLK